MKPQTVTLHQLSTQAQNIIWCKENELLVTNHLDSYDILSEPTNLDAVTIIVMLSGRIKGVINNEPFDIKGSYLLGNLPSNVIQIDEVEDLHYYMVAVSMSYLDAMNLDTQMRTNFYLDIRSNPIASIPRESISVLRPFYDLLSTLKKYDAEVRDFITQNLARTFAYGVMSLVRQYRPYVTGNIQRTRHEVLFDKFIELLTEYHTSHRLVQFYADQLCLTPNYLSGAVRASSGHSAQWWINEYVVTEAKTMLRNTDYNIQEITSALNFPTQSSFGKFFKQQTGVSPKTYRKSKQI